MMRFNKIAIFALLRCSIVILGLIITTRIYGISTNFSNTELPSMNTSPSAPLDEFTQPEFLYFYAAMVPAITLVGTLGNVLAIVAVVSSIKVRNKATCFIIHLCAADLIVYCFSLPFAAAKFFEQNWVYEIDEHILLPFLRCCTVELILLTIAALAINRCILILTSALRQKVFQRCYIYILVVFTLFVVVRLTMTSVLDKWGRFGYDSDIFTSKHKDVTGNYMHLSLFLIVFIVPSVTVEVCSEFTFWAARKNHNRSMRPAIISDCRDEETKLRKEEIEVTRIVLFVFFAFLLCYFPLLVITLSDPDIKRPKMHIFTYFLLVLNSCVHPIIYVIANKNYGNEFSKTKLVGNNSLQSQPEEARNMIASISLVTSRIDEDIWKSDSGLVREVRE